MDNPIVKWLFDTDAIRVCPEDQPFWYTSGKLGPFYINTHFLYGGEAAANGLLAYIEEQAAKDRLNAPLAIGAAIQRQLDSDSRFHALIEHIATIARDQDFDFISGGERRDFFFSLPVARALGAPHVSIFKDLTCVYTNGRSEGLPAAEAGLTGKRALHIADLITEASSYTRAWLPAITNLGARMHATIAVVDRNQGGRRVLAEEAVPMFALTTVDPKLFHTAAQKGLLTPAQHDMVCTFLHDPDAFMRDFLRTHPNYLAEQIALGGKAQERAERCIAQGFDRLS